MLQQIGYFSKTQGLKGHLHLHIIQDFDIGNCVALMVELPAGQVPQFIDEFRESKKGFVVLLEDIDSIDKAKLLVGKKVFVKSELIFEDNVPDYRGYRLIDKAFGEVGLIDGVEDTGTSLLLNITRDGKQILLPFNDDLIEHIDDENKQIHYLAPEGLIEMYL